MKERIAEKIEGLIVGRKRDGAIHTEEQYLQFG